MQGSFAKAVILGIVLLALWLLMSGIYVPLIIGFGVISSILCVWIAYKLGILDAEGVPHSVNVLSMIRYAFWLVAEIAKADWAVAKVILSPDMNLRQRLIRVPATENSDLGKVIYANSITITPGTLTVEIEKDSFIVHSLTDEAADYEALADMNARVCHAEGSTVRGRVA